MENIIILTAKDAEADKKKIEGTWQEGPVYVLDNEETLLYQYLDALYDEYELSIKILYKMRICKQQKLASGSVTLIQGGKQYKPGSISELLGMLDEGEKCSIVIETDDRVLLANILQQLIYIDYPITLVDMKLRKEYKDAEKTKRFMERLDRLYAGAKKAEELICELCVAADEKNAEELYKLRAEAVTAYCRIGEQIEKARGVEMKVAVAASKKTGKSVIVNSMIGMELAPTSNELATPNNCIYRKSNDGKFHLEYNGKKEDYANADELRQRINREFKEAERNTEDNFRIPDMDISYVSEGNNFDSYTVYDTPGPDAAGTKHNEPAEKAMAECDVAVFAIDYSKYLIPSEEEYLGRIKKMFEEKGKFHSLIFVINKLDLALADKGGKSRVKSIDFIRRRLRDIDDRYGDCVIFATSAQDYFYTVDMERAARDGEQFAEYLSPLIKSDADLRGGLEEILDDFGDDMDDDLRTVLSNLESEAGRVRRQLGYKDHSLQGMKDYSGMPQLMSHIAYVAQSKAREEIVNGITFAIDQQQSALQDIINRAENLDRLMNANEEQIQSIREILEEFRQEIDPLLKPAVTREETTTVFFKSDSDNDSALATHVNILAKQGSGFPVDLRSALRGIGKDVEGTVSDKQIRQGLWLEYKPAQKDWIKKAAGKEFIGTTSEQLKEVLSLPADKLTGIVTTYLNDTLKERQTSVEKDIASAHKCLQKILQVRMEKLVEKTEACQELLDKTGVALQLPSMPEFDCAISLPSIQPSSSFQVRVSMKSQADKLLNEYGSVRNFINWFFIDDAKGDLDKYHRGEVKKVPEADLNKAVESVKAPFYDALDAANVYGKLQEKFKELAKNVDAVRDQLNNNFQNITDTCNHNIEVFEATIDDRDRFREENEVLARKKDLIGEIQDASQDFLTVWKEIIG